MAADNTRQRQMVATGAVKACVALTEAIYQLEQYKDQRDKFISPFVDTDFESSPTNVGLSQCDAAMLGQLFDFVLPTLVTWFEDQANGGRNKQITLQMRSG